MKKEAFIRVNTRIPADQDSFIKNKSKKEDKSQGEVYREIIGFYITNNKKKNG